MSYDKKQHYTCKKPFTPCTHWRHLPERPLNFESLNLTLLCLYWLCFCLAFCLSLHGIHTTSLAEVFPLFPLIGQHSSPLTRQDNWTCNSNPGIPIRVSLHPLCIECSSYLSVISLWTSLWPLDQREYTILSAQTHLELEISFTHWQHPVSVQDGYVQCIASNILCHLNAPKIQRTTAPSTMCWERDYSSWGTLLELFMRGFISKYSAARWSSIIHA